MAGLPTISGAKIVSHTRRADQFTSNNNLLNDDDDVYSPPPSRGSGRNEKRSMSPSPSKRFTSDAMGLMAEMRGRMADHNNSQQRGGASRGASRSGSRGMTGMSPKKPSTPMQQQQQGGGGGVTHRPSTSATPNSLGVLQSASHPATMPPTVVTATPTTRGTKNGFAKIIDSSLLSSSPGVKFTVPKKEMVTRKPPPAERFSPVFAQGISLEQTQESEAELLRKQYNKRAPWDKTPLWRPLTRGNAQMLHELNQAEGSSPSPASPPGGTEGDNINLSGDLSPRSTQRALGSTKAARVVNPVQAKAVVLQEKLLQSLSPARSDAHSPTNTFGLSDQEGSGVSYGSGGSGVDECSPPRHAVPGNNNNTNNQQIIQIPPPQPEDEAELFGEELLEFTNSTAHRPAARSLLASHFCGETRGCSSPLKQREQAKQFAWNKTGRNLTCALPSNGRAPHPGVIAQMNSLMVDELNNTTTTTGGVWSNAPSSTCNSTTPGPPFSKDNELDRMSWMLHRRAERRKGQVAAKIVGGSVIPPGQDIGGQTLNYIVSHRRLHESE